MNGAKKLHSPDGPAFNAANELREAQIKFQKALDALNDNQ